MNPLVKLAELGQSVWIDHLGRSGIQSGELRRQIREDALRGITSNPAIFEQSITKDRAYEPLLRAHAGAGRAASEIYEAIAVADIQLAADELRSVYDQTNRSDGFASLEVSPHLAYETVGTIDEARRLFRAVDRPNVMIKVPATVPGLAAIEALIGDGIPVNITLLFGLTRYQLVVDAYLAGLESRMRRGLSVDVPSVASFFLSRIDTAVDAELDRRNITNLRLRGVAAIASAKTAYALYGELFTSPRFQHLEERGARRQRLLWASTSTKNPAYPDTYYVEALVGENTIDTMPVATFEAYRDHGHPTPTLTENLGEARRTLAELAQLGIDLDEVARRLELEGVQKFTDAHDRLLASIRRTVDGTSVA